MINDNRVAPDRDVLNALCSRAPHLSPVLWLLGTSTGSLVLERLPDRLRASIGFKPEGGWLARVCDDESAEYVAVGPHGFDEAGLCWLWDRADVVCVYAGRGEVAHYSRFAALARAGRRVVLIETQVERQNEWMIEVDRHSKAVHCLITPKPPSAKNSIRDVG